MYIRILCYNKTMEYTRLVETSKADLYSDMDFPEALLKRQEL